jgi:putative ABC transport system permease protein
MGKLVFFIENFKIALDSIKSNTLRSFLTMLGIIIGISSVITIVSLGEGGKARITGEFEKIGAATINVNVRAQEAQNSDYITLEDIRYIKEKVGTVKYVSPIIQKNGFAITEKKTKRSFMFGVNEDFGNIQSIEIVYGRMFHEKEVLENKGVVVIDENTAKSLYGTDDVVGRSMMLGTRTSPKRVTVVGVSKSSAMMFGEDENIPAIVYSPVTFVQSLFPNENQINSITVMATSKESSEEAGNGTLNLLQNRHGNRGREVYKAESVLKQLDQVNQVLGIFTAFIGAVAAISLLVGGIGVMNIMLVSVTERTREIGIRKAIGATTNTIMLQFLTESVIISLIGGVIGLILGLLGGEVIGSFASISPVLSTKAIVGAILFSSAVGIFFGIYPARKAAKLDPIDALRYE